MDGPTFDDNEPIKKVQLEGLVALKIIKHTKENLPELVTGQLLGLDVGNTLEVTACFPFPNKIDNEEDGEDLGSAEYQLEMMRCLRDVNVDNNTVGWYTAAFGSSFLDESTIEIQFNYQDKIPKCVMICYDPIKTSNGFLAFKAYRLSEQFMEFYRTQTFTKENLEAAKFSYSNIFEEIPIQLHNSGLINALLFEMEESEQLESNFRNLELSNNNYLERSLEFMIECFDDLSSEQTKFQYWQRNVQKQQASQNAWLQKRKAENAARKLNGEEPLPEEMDPQLAKLPQEPSRLESLLITNQIDNYCKQVNSFAIANTSKLFLQSTSWK